MDACQEPISMVAGEQDSTQAGKQQGLKK